MHIHVHTHTHTHTHTQNTHTHTHSYTHTHTQHTSTLITHSDKIKDAVIAKIAMQASDLSVDAYSNMLVGSVKQQWDKVGQSLTSV